MTREIGKTFGRLHILGEPLVQHETTVYRAYDPSQDRQLALTVIPVRPASAGGDPKAVLQRALKLLEQKHPHIVNFETAGRDVSASSPFKHIPSPNRSSGVYEHTPAGLTHAPAPINTSPPPINIAPPPTNTPPPPTNTPILPPPTVTPPFP